MPTFRKTIVKGVVANKSESHQIVVSRQELETLDKPQVQIDLRKMIDAAVTEQDWIAIIGKARDMALDGDRKWAEFLFKYRWGLPPQMVQHAGKIGTGITIVEVIRNPDDENNEIIEGTAEEVP